MKHPSHLLDSLFTNTHSLPPPNPLRFPPSQNWPASCQAKTVCLPSVSLHQSLLTSPTFYKSIPPYSSQLCNPSAQSCTPPTPLHSVWTRLAWGNKQRRVCVRGGRDGVSLREGTMLLLVALNLRLLLWVSVCVSLINYLDFTFTEALNTSPRYQGSAPPTYTTVSPEAEWHFFHPAAKIQLQPVFGDFPKSKPNN